MKDIRHIEMRSKIELLMNEGLVIDEIAKKLNLSVGTRYIEGSAKWYRFCVIAKMNQRKAIEKHPNLYSEAGRIAQQKHPWIGHELGRRYGKLAGKKAAQRLEGNSEYFSRMAKILHELKPEHSKHNMIKAHQTMKKDGSFNRHQMEAALICKEKHPDQLKNMSKRAHQLYPLALLALESRRRNYPYEFMGCLFDSSSEMKLCELLVKNRLIDKPEEGKNVHYRINKHHIDFFINNQIFIEYHPPLPHFRNGETLESYCQERRNVLDKNGYKGHPLVVIGSLKNIESQIVKIKDLLSFKANNGE